MALAKSQGISLSTLFSRKFEALDDDLLASQLAARRFLQRIENEPSLPPQEKSDKEMRHEYLAKSMVLKSKRIKRIDFWIYWRSLSL
jgi:hypothetical protein